MLFSGIPRAAARSIAGAILLLLLAHLRLAAQIDSLAAPDSAGYQLRILRFTYPKIDIRVSYPELDGASAVVKDINGQLREYAREKLAHYKAEAFEGLRLLREIERKEHPRRRPNDSDLFDLYAHERVRLWRIGDEMVSVVFEAEWFFGGAHPADEYRSFLYDLTAARPRSIPFAELFSHDSSATAMLVEAYLRAAMREEAGRNEPRFTADQLRAAVSAEALETLALTPAGILVEGRPLARYIGVVRALIPYADVASTIDPSGPLARYLAARAGAGG